MSYAGTMLNASLFSLSDLRRAQSSPRQRVVQGPPQCFLCVDAIEKPTTCIALLYPDGLIVIDDVRPSTPAELEVAQ